jgi:hypothetical protein
MNTTMRIVPDFCTAPTISEWESGAGARALQSGLPAARPSREAPWSAARQRRFGRETGCDANLSSFSHNLVLPAIFLTLFF